MECVEPTREKIRPKFVKKVFCVLPDTVRGAWGARFGIAFHFVKRHRFNQVGPNFLVHCDPEIGTDSAHLSVKVIEQILKMDVQDIVQLAVVPPRLGVIMM